MTTTFPTALRDALADRYAIQHELDAGGMATVYLAHDTRHDRPVAIKVLRDEHGMALGAERFDREIKLLARLRHPFVLPLHDSGAAAGSLYFVMPYIDGESLRARLARDGRVPVADAVEIVRQVADALAYAHGEGVVHRDVKPENILLSRRSTTTSGIGRGRRAVELNPVSVLPHMNLGIVHDFGAHHPEALAEFRRVAEMDPSFVRVYTFLAMELVWVGDREGAVREARVAHGSAPDYAMFAMPLAIALHGVGQIKEARAMKARAFAAGLPPVYRAMVHAMFGERDDAIAALDRGYEERAHWMYTLPVQAYFRELRGNPRFVALVEKVRHAGPP
ncbi:MAG TPA: protein kinase [Gemmatimonadaceae bacterium]|nr:protein kinase [Gemmatimonadaceae bacterium]